MQLRRTIIHRGRLIKSSRIINNIAGNGVFRWIEFQRHSIINPYILNP